MPVNSTHPDYDATLPAWLRARDVIAGEDAVKDGGEKYLPRLDSQSDNDYLGYKSRASFFNATARTADGYVGLIFRREPTFKLPDDRQALSASDGSNPNSPHLASGHPLPLPQARDKRRGSGSGVGRALDAFVEDADMRGTSLSSYAKNVTTEVISVGRAGSLVDWAGSTGGPMDNLGQDAEQRAYAVLYQAEQIINWRSERVNGRNVLTLVVLRETLADGHKDDFEVTPVEQIRVLKLVPGNTSPQPSVQAGPATVSGEGADVAPRQNGSSPSALTRPADTLSHSRGRGTGGAWQYVVEIWQERKTADNRRKKAEWMLVESRTPLRLGKPLPLIPFVFHGPRNFLPDVDKLPLADIIFKNLDHYRLDADYKHGLHFTALPTAWVVGYDKPESLKIGSSTVWVASSVDSKAGFLEFTGQGLTTFERAMDRDEQLMALLGSRMLEASKRVGETADAIELRQSGENSVLSAVSLSVSDSLTHMLRWVYWWNSTEATPEAIGDDAVLVTLNTDFKTKGMASDQITAIVSAWQAGAISRDTMFELFRKGEVLPVGRSNEEESRLLVRAGLATMPKPETGNLKPESASAREPLPTAPGDVNAEPVNTN